MSIAAVAFIAGLSFFFVLLSGLWLSRSGRPLKAGISAIHKLISLAAGLFLLVVIYQQNKAAALGGAEWLAIAITAICFLAVVASGGLLSSEEPRPVAVLRVHQIVPVLTVLSSALTLYLLLGL